MRHTRSARLPPPLNRQDRCAMRSVHATRDERTRALPGDERIPKAIDTLTHAVTIRRPPLDVWPWLLQMGAGKRAGWYSYDWLDNGRQPSAARIVPEWQHPEVGSVFPALPGATEGFTLLAIEPERLLMLGWLARDGTADVTWTFVLEKAGPGATRLLVRARGGPGNRFHGLPLQLTRVAVRIVHFFMQRKQLLGLARRAEATPLQSPFRSAGGEAAFTAAYDAAMKAWPVPLEEMDVSSRFGTTHVIACGPKNAPPLVLLHGYTASSVMWTPNIADFCAHHRVYAIDTMGQPGKSIPDEPIRSAADYVAWLTATLDALHLDRVDLLGMSFGGWLAITYASAAPASVRKLVLLSAGGVLPIARAFQLRGMVMMLLPSRFTVRWFMRWAGFGSDAEKAATGFLDVMYRGLKYFRMPAETMRIVADPLSDAAMRA